MLGRVLQISLPKSVGGILLREKLKKMMTLPSGEGGGFEWRRRELLSSCENGGCSV